MTLENLLDKITFKQFMIFESVMIFILITLLTSHFLIIPSYRSTVNKCTTSKCNKDDFSNTLGYYVSATDEIVILVEEGTFLYKRVLLHEICHQNQNYQGRLKPGDDKYGRFKNEIECNLREWEFWKW